MGLKLITESNFEDISSQSVVEDVTAPGVKCYYIEGVILQGNLQNKNKRIYPVELLDREVARYNRDYISQNRALGELGHPEGPTINLERASHMFVALHRDGTNYFGRAKVLTQQEMGRKVAGFIDEGVKLGISSRGVGSIRNVNGTDIVQNDYFLATAGDIVHDPSAPGAFVRGIMEGKEWAWEEGILKESVIAGYHQLVKNAPSARLEEVRLQVFQDFMDRISKSTKN